MRKRKMMMNQFHNNAILKGEYFMTTFVGYEYLIGNAFIYLTDERFLTLKELFDYQNKLQKYWISNNIDAVFAGEIEDVYAFSEYFEFRREAKLIILNSNISKDTLRHRFVGYLPWDIVVSFANATI